MGVCGTYAKKLSPYEEKIINEQTVKNICKIKINNIEKGIGFLCKIQKLNTKILITNTQFFDKEEIKNIQNFELIIYDNPSIYLDNSTLFNINESLKIMVIEINNNLNESYFLEIDEDVYDNNYIYINKFIYLLNNSYSLENNNNKNVTVGIIKYVDDTNNILEYIPFGSNSNTIFSLIITLKGFKVIGINNLKNNKNGIILKSLLEEFIGVYQKKDESSDDNSDDNMEPKYYYLKKYNVDRRGRRLSKSLNELENINLNKINFNISNCNINNKQSSNFNTNLIMSNNINNNINNNFTNNNSLNCMCSLRKEFCSTLEGNISINIKFFCINNNNYVTYPKKDLSGLLCLCLIKLISNLFDDNYKYLIPEWELQNIIGQLRDSFFFSQDTKENIKLILKKEIGNNILLYSNYINAIINNNKIYYLANFMDFYKQGEIDAYWRCLSYYEEYNSFFEKEFIKDLKQTFFDYSLVSLNILERNDEYIYKQKRNECPNMIKRILYHGTQIDPIAEILTDNFKYSRKPFYGMGIYFSDMIDYTSFYCGGNNFDGRRDNFGKIIPINNSFSLIASEIFYDKSKLIHIKDSSLRLNYELNSFPTYNDLKEYFPDKMVQPNGIHFIKVDHDGEPIGDNTVLKEGQFIGTEYAITELYQIFPIYSLTLKRNEYFVLWRDPNFSEGNNFSEYLYQRILFCNYIANMNIYCETSTEEALKFLWRRKYNKIILITSVGEDLSGKKFVEVARQILGFNVIVLFFSSNINNLKWIQNFDNCLYTNEKGIYEYYISNFNKYGLKNLKKMVERKYNITLKDFSDDFISYPKFVNNIEFKELNYSEKNPYVKEVYIFCEKKNMYLIMTNDGNIMSSYEPEAWDVIMINKRISFFSNGYYLGVKDDKENTTGIKKMKNWYFKNIAKNYYIFADKDKKSNNILSMEGTWIKVNKEQVGKYELFSLIEK